MHAGAPAACGLREKWPVQYRLRQTVCDDVLPKYRDSNPAAYWYRTDRASTVARFFYEFAHLLVPMRLGGSVEQAQLGQVLVDLLINPNAAGKARSRLTEDDIDRLRDILSLVEKITKRREGHYFFRDYPWPRHYAVVNEHSAERLAALCAA